MFKAKKFYRLNQYIPSLTLRVIDEKGKQIGVMSKAEAIAKANELGVDLVEVAPKANPPVCRLIDFKKFRYQEAKKEAAEKRKNKGSEIKEIRFSPFEKDSSLDFKLKKAEEFLKEGNRVKIAVIFRRWQIAKKEFGYKLIKTATERLSSKAELEAEPKLAGFRMEGMLRPCISSKSKSPSAKDSE